MTTSSGYRLPQLSAGGMRLLSGGGVVLLHVLLALAILFRLHATRPVERAGPSLVLLALKPEALTLEPRPVSPARSFAPPAAALTSPVFTLAPREPRGLAVPQAEAPAAVGPGGATAERKTPQDLFSDEKKEAFKRFFQQQAIEDRRENAKAARADGRCSVFRKPGEEAMPDEQTSNGIPRNFVPAFGIGVHAPDDGKVSMQPCD